MDRSNRHSFSFSPYILPRQRHWTGKHLGEGIAEEGTFSLTCKAEVTSKSFAVIIFHPSFAVGIQTASSLRHNLFLNEYLCSADCSQNILTALSPTSRLCKVVMAEDQEATTMPSAAVQTKSKWDRWPKSFCNWEVKGLCLSVLFPEGTAAGAPSLPVCIHVLRAPSWNPSHLPEVKLLLGQCSMALLHHRPVWKRCSWVLKMQERRSCQYHLQVQSRMRQRCSINKSTNKQ